MESQYTKTVYSRQMEDLNETLQRLAREKAAHLNARTQQKKKHKKEKKEKEKEKERQGSQSNEAGMRKRKSVKKGRGDAEQHAIRNLNMLAGNAFSPEVAYLQQEFQRNMAAFGALAAVPPPNHTMQTRVPSLTMAPKSALSAMSVDNQVANAQM